MSGHSKWATIKRKKGANDAKRGKLFARLIKAIEAAARDGGADPDMNPTLATMVQKAKDASVPKDNIQRALDRAAGKEGGGADWETVYYEGYAPGGVALYVQCLTDNRNRAAADVRSAFTKHGGSLAEPGAVNYLFTRTGVIEVPADGVEEDDLLMAGLDAGLEDVTSDGETFTATCQPEDVIQLRKALEEAGITVASSDSTMLPSVQVPLTDEESAKKVLRLIDALEDADDVQDIYANYDISDDILEAVA
ncbi:YebC/PmpR family DNA-binding transcriptional regulator [Euzebya tangerina]|uniref:YebC/PmpR family DNA-binding transcriptional regulator n=1 Tax=Euzebya tangerina TaxID=591198 RepID=UPI000E320159|nr:YebC/PmpR family DNA-binding transcriptional regulator [Euzebya tangerina]